MRDELRVSPDQPADLPNRPTDLKFGGDDKDAGKAFVKTLYPRLFELQRRLWGEDARSVLLVLQGMDAAGKDGAIRNLARGLNPQGTHVAGFRAPSGEERDHDYLWRIHDECPRRGELGIFNRSHYEDVGIVRVLNLVPEDRWRKRYRHIREFERMLSDEGTTIVKVWLHVSKEEQKARFQSRLDDPTKRWKFNPDDLESRARWDDYMAAYTEALDETSTDYAPWYVVPTDRKWARDVALATLLIETLEEMDPQYPPEVEGLDDIVIE